MEIKRISAGLLAGVSVVALGSAAFAQAPEAAAVSEVVVTGSRVIQNGNNSPTPLTTSTFEALQTMKPGTIAEGLTLLPIFAGSRGQTGNPSINGGVGGGNGSANQLNLRNVGSLRNLVLFDGHRIPPTLFSGVVDMDMVPQNLIERVDMVTGGVSAVYGSDAVTGVINFITNKTFNGVKANAQYGIAGRGDAVAWNGSLAVGRDLGDRAHFIGSYEYRDDRGILRKSARPWFEYHSAGGAGTEAAPYYLITGARNSNSTFGGLIGAGSVLAGQNFAQNGVLSPLVAGTAVGNGSIRIGGDGVYGDQSLKMPLKSHQVFGRLDYDFTDNVRGNLVMSGNFKTNYLYDSFPSLNATTISRDNAFLPAVYRNQLVAANQQTFTIARNFLDYTSRYGGEPKTNQVYFAATLEGELGAYSWEVAATHGSSNLKMLAKNNINRENLSAAIDAVAGPSGPVCQSVAIRPNCVALNLFGPTAYNPAALDYVLEDTHFDALTKMDDVSGQIVGAPFSLPAGEVRMALSGEWRKISYRSISDHPADLYADCTGLRFNCVATGNGRTVKYFQTLANRSRVSQSVGEVALEANVPLLKDLALADDLSVNGAVRYTSYDTSGEYVSWKAGLDWHINDDVRVRATRSRDIRAPNLFDLRATTFITVGGVTDAVNNNVQLQNIPQINYSIPTLTAEIGKTTTAGMVFTPSFLPGFSLAIDYFNIKIGNAIQTIQGGNARVQAACRDTIRAGNAPTASLACQLQSRSPTQVQGAGVYSGAGITPLTAIYTANFNIGSVRTHGVDFEANYRTTLFDRPLQLRALTTYQPHLYYNYGDLGLTEDDVAGYAQGGPAATLPTPVWRATLFAGYQPIDRLKVDLVYRWRSELGMDAQRTVIWTYKVPSYHVFNLNLNADVGPVATPGRYTAFLNISNLFDKSPPMVPGTGTPGGNGGWVINDDWIGRYFTFGVRAKF